MNRLIQGDCLEVMRSLPPRRVDLVFGSPPYEDARTYGIDFKLKGQEWVDWMVKVYRESLRISKGLVAFVVQGRTRKYEWSCTPALLIADLHRAGFNVRNPVLYVRHGIPGSGGPDWLKSRYEWIVCVSQPGRLAWSDNTACGHPPKCGAGGPMSNRDETGERLFNKQTRRKKDGSRGAYKPSRPLPKMANPGNIIDCGANTHFGLANENEAPFPEKLAEFFVKSFCPPGGTVLDPFSGSGTTAAVAKKNNRHYIGIDVRQSQIELAQRRLSD